MMSTSFPNNTLRLERILETCLYADDLDKAERFYTSVLGLHLHAKETGRHLFFKCGSQMLLIFNPAKTIQESDAAPHGAHGPGHVAFAVPLAELNQWKSHLEAMNISIEKEVSWPNGGCSIYFRDPAGNSLELASPLLWGMPDDDNCAHPRPQ
jgi:catechol 2,3-dioxygenase-like lactoylglutathione lyase family enzyme